MTLRVSTFLIVVLTLFAWGSGRGSAASLNRWTSIGPNGGTVRAVAIDPANPSIVYAGAAGGGIFKSTDGGSHWSAANLGLDSRATIVNAIVIDTITPSTVYAATRVGLFKSVDRGATWNATPLMAEVVAVAIDPATPTTLYAATRENGLVKITSAGGSSLLVDSRVQAVVVDPLTPSTVYAGTDSGLFKSSDGGASWSMTSLGAYNIETLAIDPRNPTTVYASVSFQKCQYFDDYEVCDDYFDLFKSADGGSTWIATEAGLNGSAVYALAIDPVSSDTLYGGTNVGIFKTTNGGGGWNIVANGLSVTSQSAIAVNPLAPSLVYVGTDERGVFKTTDAGGLWTASNTGLVSTYVQTLAIDPHAPNTLYAGTSIGVFKSTNAGGSWNEANTGLTSRYIQALAIDPQNPATLYAAAFGTGAFVFKSTDGAASWTTIGQLRGVRVLVVDPLSPTTIYAGSDQGVFKSTDAGGSWGTPRLAVGVLSLAIDPLTPTTVYAGGGQGLFRSGDGGDNWTVVADHQIGLYNPYIDALALDPRTPTTVYLGTCCSSGTYGVLKSTDGGGSWTAVNTGLTSQEIGALALDPQTPTILYATTFASQDNSGGDVFRSQDGGGTWSPLDAGRPPKRIQSLAIASATPTTVYAMSSGAGVFAISGDQVPNNVPPAAAFTFACSQFTCTFDGSGSADPDGTISSYVWNFGDGWVGLGTTVSHSYAAAGAYSASLTVSDNDGAANAQTSTVVINQPGIHVGDLDGTSMNQQKTWMASVMITVHDDVHNPIESAMVTSTWNDGSTSSCWTSSNGQCTLARFGIPNKTLSASLTVTNVVRFGFEYRPSENHDPDHDSTGTAITIKR
jgi:photosystem II stability/assembly factor-like uncharacterized protein